MTIATVNCSLNAAALRAKNVNQPWHSSWKHPRYTTSAHTSPKYSQHAQPVEDFIRNFLLRHGMKETLQCFQVEWYPPYAHDSLFSLSDTQVCPTAE